LKKVKILALFFDGVFAGVFAFAEAAFFPPVPLLITGTLLFELGRGVSGFVDMAKGIERDVEMPFGGVGGLPVDGATGDEERLAFARGLRNIAR
jgi:hypothetical protein